MDPNSNRSGFSPEREETVDQTVDLLNDPDNAIGRFLVEVHQENGTID